MEDIVYIGSKNKYGYTKRQLKIDYKNKNYEIGQFVMVADKIVTNKAIDEKVVELDKMGFYENCEEYEKLKKECGNLPIFHIIEKYNVVLSFLDYIDEVKYFVDNIPNFLMFDIDKVCSSLGLSSDEII